MTTKKAVTSLLLSVKTANLSEVTRPELLKMVVQCHEKAWRFYRRISGHAKVDTWASLSPVGRTYILDSLESLEAILPQFKRLRDELLSRGRYKGKRTFNTDLLDERVAEVKAWIALNTSTMPANGR